MNDFCKTLTFNEIEQELLTPGLFFNMAELKENVKNPQLPYFKEANEEAARNAEAPSGDCFNMKLRNSILGKCAELILREGWPEYYEPISKKNIDLAKVPFDDFYNKFSRYQRILYHDLFFKPTCQIVEVKCWNINNIEKYLDKFKNEQFKNHNFSARLNIFAHDNIKIWFYGAINLLVIE